MEYILENKSILLLSGILALIFVFIKDKWVSNQSVGNEKMAKIANNIADGAMSFLKAEYTMLSFFVIIVGGLLTYLGYLGEATSTSHSLLGFSFLMGAICSGLAGFIGMKVATKANVRTTNAAQNSLGEALSIAFSGGAVMGLGVVGLGMLGLTGLYLFYESTFTAWSLSQRLEVLTGFSFGASSIALFARVGGGIYTKAADVGADLVGKVEAGIPEDHPLNPATIADNVGDNVGDVAGMGADLFESYVGSIIATMVLGSAIFVANGSTDAGMGFVILPLVLAATGILCSIIGTFFVKVNDGGSPHKALNLGEFLSALIMLIASYFIITGLLPNSWSINGTIYYSIGAFFATIAGLVAGLSVGKITEYYTGTGTKPVNEIVKQSETGAATNIIAGLGIGMMSTAIPILLISAAILIAHSYAGLYGIAIAAVGNTTAAIGKGFAIASAALTALALFAAFADKAELTSINVMQPKVMVGLLIGAMLPFVFSALAMNAVGRAAMSMIQEVRRQFKEIPSLKAALEIMKKYNADLSNATEEDRKIFDEADGKAEYDKCVAISTQASIREMVMPGLLAVFIPILIGFGGGKEMLGGLLAGVTACGVLMAIFQSNAGGAWDNAKKTIEEEGRKGTDAHKAAVVGDTVGDPFKDTSGPSLNILIKLMSVVALVIASSIV